jgi:hypothetical protein
VSRYSYDQRVHVFVPKVKKRDQKGVSGRHRRKVSSADRPFRENRLKLWPRLRFGETALDFYYPSYITSYVVNRLPSCLLRSRLFAGRDAGGGVGRESRSARDGVGGGVAGVAAAKMIRLFSLKQQKKDGEGQQKAGNQKQTSAAQLRVTKGETR